MGKNKNPFYLGNAIKTVKGRADQIDTEMKKAMGITPTNRLGESPDEHVERKISEYPDGYKKHE